MNLRFLLPLLIVLLLRLSDAARIDSGLSERQARQNIDRGSYRFQVPSYLNPENYARTIYSTDRRDPDGSFSYSYETDNAIKAKQESTGYGPNKVVRGYYSYIGSDGVPYTVNYIADRFGYRAYGQHLPTQPDAIYDQTKLPIYRPTNNPYYAASSPSIYPVSTQNYQTQTPYYPPAASLLTQPIYVSDASAPNYVHVTPKPFHSSYPSSTQPSVSVLPPHSHFSPNYSNQPYAWTTAAAPYNNGFSSTTVRPYAQYK